MFIHLFLGLLLLVSYIQECSDAENKAKTSKEALPEAKTDDAPTALLARPMPDDLTRIRGIGARTAEQLQAAGIVTFDDLAALNHDQLMELLRGPRLHSSTWPEQARLAAAGDWQALEEFQVGL